MMRIFAGVIFFVLTLSTVASPRLDSNFGFGGATTNTANATDSFAPTLGPAIRAAGLDLVGLSQQLTFADAVLVDIDADRDVFWLWAGTNNILIASVTGVFEPFSGPLDIYLALEHLYTNMGARIFVVPNLMLLGNIPQYNTVAEQRDEINAQTESQNAFLKLALEIFAIARPDAKVISPDVQSLFTELESSSEFDNVTEACFTTGLPNGIPCATYLYADDIHFSSAAAAKIAALAAEELQDVDVRRLVTLGDSFVDTGSFFDTTLRSLGFGIPTPPSFSGRFSDGPNVIDQVEQLLGVDFVSTAFSQPKRATLDSSATLTLDQAANVIVPKRITLSEPVLFFSTIDIQFDTNGSCQYSPSWFVGDKLLLTSCTAGLQAGETVLAQSLSFTQSFIDTEVSLDLFFYD